MGASLDGFSRWYLASCLPGTPLAHVQHRHVLGCYREGGQRHIILRRSSSHFEEVQGHLHLVHLHDHRHDRVGWCWTSWQVGAIPSAHQRLYCHLAVGYHRCQSLLVAYRFESWIDAVHLVSIGRAWALVFCCHGVLVLWVWGQKGKLALPR